MLEADQLYIEGLFHVGRGAGQGDGTTENFVAAREYLQVVLGGELPDEVHLGGISAIGFGEVGVAENLAAMFVEVEGLAVFEDDRDFDELVWRSRSDGTCSRHRGVLGPLQRNFLRFCIVVSPLETCGSWPGTIQKAA
jgi:hypothetical protein